MSTTIQPQADSAHNPKEASTRHMLVDRRFAAILHEDFPVLPAADIRRALEDEPRKAAIQVCVWASGTGEPARALLCWARKHRRGTYSADAPLPSGDLPGADRGSDIARWRQVTRRPIADIAAGLERMAV